MKKHIISSLLLASMLLTFAACSDGPVKDTTVPDATVSTDELPAGIAKQNYKGSVNILMPEWSLYTKCFAPGDDMTDVLNKALYNRENKVENHLGVEITYETVAKIQEYYAMISTAIATNDDLYQILLSHCIQDNGKLITDGYVTDMNNLGIDFTADWFNHKANDALEVAGKQFFCISDYMIPDPNVIVFNNGIVDRLQLENPYDLVREGKWTIDKMTEMASKVTAENGDTVWNHEDTYGFGAPDDWYLSSFIHGADVKIIDRNNEGEFELLFGDERSYDLMDKLNTLINGPDTYVFFSAGLTPNSPYAETSLSIGSDRCLFSILNFSSFWSIRDISTDFGILPFPKFDEIQEEYYSLDWSGLMSVPFSVSEDSYSMVGDVIELLAYHSEEEVIPAYIEDTLGVKFARDENWTEMLEIVFGSTVFDPTLSYFGFDGGTNDFLYSVDHMLVDKKGNIFASFLETHRSAAEATIAAFNEAVSDIEG